jgi:hypothetical protein
MMEGDTTAPGDTEQYLVEPAPVEAKRGRGRPRKDGLPPHRNQLSPSKRPPTDRKAGRPRGAKDRPDEEMYAWVKATGKTPLEYMIETMRDETAPTQRRDEMAKAAAPYVHSKISSIEVGGKKNSPVHVSISAEDKSLL